MTDPIALALRVAAILDEHDVSYALGGSLASSMFGEPRGTIDIDMAIRLEQRQFADLMNTLEVEFYVPAEAARRAVEQSTSFNLIDDDGLKVDLFVLGESPLDQHQLEHRQRILVREEPPQYLWVSAPASQVLRKLEWYQAGGSVSERQWRDVIGILRAQRSVLDLADLTHTAQAIGLGELLDTALRTAEDNA
ncbi:MAG: hypothetical protein F4190_05720 [Acidimicrobiales bacterium]|nr:hypothetical protein [Acidimicrobiales bacterium]MYG88011.1 hypothetical protein [Acidimicrobiales bacterium]MYI28554.1 hypothetical protein [Acidimicrobiales bacterium]